MPESGRPGPVLIDLPKDMINATTPYKTPDSPKLKSYSPNYNPNNKQLQKVVKLIKEAQRPAIFAGGGIILSKSSMELTEFARKAQIPVMGSLMGLGSFPGTDALWAGNAGNARHLSGEHGDRPL